MAEWQPISTAPEDGTAILIACDQDRQGMAQVTLAWREEGEWVEAKTWDASEEDWILMGCAFDPTHWMPLPDPPRPENEKDTE